MKYYFIYLRDILPIYKFFSSFLLHHNLKFVKLILYLFKYFFFHFNLVYSIKFVWHFVRFLLLFFIICMISLSFKVGAQRGATKMKLFFRFSWKMIVIGKKVSEKNVHPLEKRWKILGPHFDAGAPPSRRDN